MDTAKPIAEMTAIIVSFESGEVLPACLASLRAENIPAIVVDNASFDNSVEVARNSGAVVLQKARNEGFGRGMNYGAAEATSEYLLLLNPDAEVQPGFAKNMRKALEDYSDAGILGPRIMDHDGVLFFPVKSLLSPYLQNPRKIRLMPEGDCCAPFLSGACYLIRRELFLELGGFDRHIFLFYEDNDLCRRVIEAGHPIIYVHEAEIRHAQGKSSKPVKGRKFNTRWHYAWSEGYISAKYGLKNPCYGSFMRNGLKYLGALLTGNRDQRERYGGAAAGAYASLCGKSAIAREGLD